MSDVRTLNLSDADDGMVALDNPTTAFVQEKNVREDKAPMDSTPLDDIMMGEPPMMDPRMQQAPPMMQPPSAAPAAPSKKANPMNLTDDQMQALIVAVATAAAISKPVQEKLAGTIPQFLNAQGGRSMVGLASTGLVAALLFYVARKYVLTPQ
jgi:hypothetical protein